MSSTNKTANYELSQFVGTDIPSILGDYNGDMRKIDAAIGEVASSAGSSASSVSSLAGRVTNCENNITTLNGALEVTNQRSVQNQSAISTLNGSVSGIEGKIPAEASSENQLVTADDLDGVSDDAKATDLRLQDVEALIPSTATTSNKLATMADVSGAGTTYTATEPIEINNGVISLSYVSQQVNYGSLNNPTYADVLGLIRTEMRKINNGDTRMAFIAIEFENKIYRAFDASFKFGCRDSYQQKDYVLALPAGSGDCSYYVDGVDKSSDTVDAYSSWGVIYGLFDTSTM